MRLVQTYATSEYIYCQFTRSFTGTSPPGQDRDLGVPQFLYFARGARYNATSFILSNENILGGSPRKERVVDYVVVPIQYPDLTLIKVHGSFMIFTFLFLIPIGIILSTFYKIVWPNGGWFFVSQFNCILLVTPSMMFVQYVLSVFRLLYELYVLCILCVLYVLCSVCTVYTVCTFYMYNMYCMYCTVYTVCTAYSGFTVCMNCVCMVYSWFLLYFSGPYRGDAGSIGLHSCWIHHDL